MDKILVFKLDHAPPVVADTLIKLGWREHDPNIDSESHWHLYWKTAR